MPPAAPKQYWCDCDRYCKRRRQVSCATWYGHAQYRNQQQQPSEDLYERPQRRRKQDAGPRARPSAHEASTSQAANRLGTIPEDDIQESLPTADGTGHGSPADQDVHMEPYRPHTPPTSGGHQPDPHQDPVPSGPPLTASIGRPQAAPPSCPPAGIPSHEGVVDETEEDEPAAQIGNRTASDENEEDLPAEELAAEDDQPGAPASRLDDIIPQIVNIPISDKPQRHEMFVSQAFSNALHGASIDNDLVDAETKERLRNPIQERITIDDPISRASLDIYLSSDSLTVDTYNSIRDSLQRHCNLLLLTYAQARRLASTVSGVVAVKTHMCINSCINYAGPWKELERCTYCSENRYEWRKSSSRSTRMVRVCRKEALTIPLGLQIQAVFRSPDDAYDCRYRQRAFEAFLEEMGLDPATRKFLDWLYGDEAIEAILRGDIGPNDLVLMFSIDGAQLYVHKQSDCWIYIWILLDRSPEKRYKKRSILIGGIIPGPNKPKNLESFIFPGFYHLAALMNDGLAVWDAYRDVVFITHPFLAFVTADGPAMAAAAGLCGHCGANGCRGHCGTRGRRKDGKGNYYPAAQRPDNYNVPGCCHDDVDLRALTAPPPPGEPRQQEKASQRYQDDLKYLLESPSQRQYLKRRLETGITRPTLINALPAGRTFPMPRCCPGDCMHLLALRLTDLFVKLWRGTLDCENTDDKSTWDWACLTEDTWKTHGAAVAATRIYIPGCFDRPPRNIAEKLTSGYKAIEFLTWFYGLGPTLLEGILPVKYWRHYCKLVRGVRLIHQHHITAQDLAEAHGLLISFCEEFEDLYVRRRADRLHFVRHSIHELCHICPDTVRLGPHVIFSQWTMERTIGLLGNQLNQPSNPYSNLAERAVRHCQSNAVRATVPALDYDKKGGLPAGAVDLQDGYVLLRAADSRPRPLPLPEQAALRAFVAAQTPAWEVSPEWFASPSVTKWARVSLPDGTIVRSLWQEASIATGGKPFRMGRNAKIATRGIIALAEVQYYFKYDIDGMPHAFAMVQWVEDTDLPKFEHSYKTVRLCRPSGKYEVVSVKSVKAIACLVPQLTPSGTLGPYEEFLFEMEVVGRDVLYLGGALEAEGEANIE